MPIQAFLSINIF